MMQEIRDYLLAHRATDVVGDFTNHDSLLESGVIDSMTMVDLIAHLEQAYGIVVNEDDMTPENFDSIGAIVAYVMRKQSSSAFPTSSN